MSYNGVTEGKHNHKLNLLTLKRGKMNLLQKMPRTVRKDFIPWLLMAPTLVLFLIFVWGPMVNSIYLSFCKIRMYKATSFAGIKNYIDMFEDSVFIKALNNSLSYTVWSFIIGFMVPIVISIMINEMIHLKSFFRVSVYFPAIVPGIATALMWTILFEPGKGGVLNMVGKVFGLAPSQWLQNTHLTIPLITIVMCWGSFGATSIIYMARLQSINQETYEAATIDGAGIWKRTRHITFPEIFSLAKVLVILQIISVFQVFSLPLAMTDGGPNNASVSLTLLIYKYSFVSFHTEKAMALGVFVFICLMICTIIHMKFTGERKSGI